MAASAPLSTQHSALRTQHLSTRSGRRYSPKPPPAPRRISLAPLNDAPLTRHRQLSADTASADTPPPCYRQLACVMSDKPAGDAGAVVVPQTIDLSSAVPRHGILRVNAGTFGLYRWATRHFVLHAAGRELLWFDARPGK